MREHAGTAAKPLVGLFLLLLVFFVLLTAGAPIDPARSRAASDSLAAAFPVGAPGGAGGERQAATMPQRLAQLFATDLAVARVVITGHGRVMQAEFPTSALFDGDQVRTALSPLLQRIAQELGSTHHGLQPALDLFFHDDGPVLPVRIDAIAQALTDLGAPAESLRIGIEPGPAGLLRLEFSLRRRDSDAQPFRAG